MDLEQALAKANAVDGRYGLSTMEQAAVVLAARLRAVRRLAEHHRNTGWVGLAELDKALNGGV